MSAFYNENDAYPAQWMRNLIDAGHIASGIVDERSVTDLEPKDLDGYEQAHFFAGIGVWSYALRLAGWGDARPVWTGSCPCQPFSAAGKRRGVEDDRHLWPAWFRLIRECRPPVVFGEQVGGAAGLAWLDAVHADLEGSGYAVGAACLPAAGVGAPHIRSRLFFMAYAGLPERRPQAPRGDNGGREVAERSQVSDRAGERRAVGELADTRESGPQGGLFGGISGSTRKETATRRCEDGRLVDANSARPRSEVLGTTRNGGGSRSGLGNPDDIQGTRLGSICGPLEPEQETSGSGFANAWSGAVLVRCADGAARPVEPGIHPLAHGATNRVGRLRAYGNAIVAPLAAEFVSAAMEAMG